MKVKRKRLKREWNVMVGDRIYETDDTVERRDEILAILKRLYPDDDVRAEKYNHYEYVWEEVNA